MINTPGSLSMTPKPVSVSSTFLLGALDGPAGAPPMVVSAVLASPSVALDRWMDVVPQTKPDGGLFMVVVWLLLPWLDARGGLLLGCALVVSVIPQRCALSACRCPVEMWNGGAKSGGSWFSLMN